MNDSGDAKFSIYARLLTSPVSYVAALLACFSFCYLSAAERS
jgi:hypothetical protein